MPNSYGKYVCNEFYQKVLYIRLEMNLQAILPRKISNSKSVNTLCPTMWKLSEDHCKNC